MAGRTDDEEKAARCRGAVKRDTSALRVLYRARRLFFDVLKGLRIDRGEAGVSEDAENRFKAGCDVENERWQCGTENVVVGCRDSRRAAEDSTGRDMVYGSQYRA